MKPYKHITKSRPLETRFWEKVDKSGGEDSCWTWLGTKVGGGYGKVWSGKDVDQPRFLNATHVSLMFDDRPLPEGMRACHTCDNPSCVNPQHIFHGTAKDNSLDMVAKGRNRCGERHGNHKLSEALVAELRSRKADGETYADLVGAFGVNRCTLHRIVMGVGWKRAGGPVQSSSRHLHKISDDEVGELRTMFASGAVSQSELAKRFNVSLAAVCNIINGVNRADAPGPITKTRTFAAKVHLSESQIQTIVELSRAGESQSKIGQRFGVTQQRIYCVLKKAKAT